MKSNETKNKKSLQPKLRFREFVSSKAWEETTIGNIGSFYYGKSAPKWSLEKDAPTPCVRYGELYTKFGPIITQTISRTNINPENLKFSKGGEILVPRVGEKPEDFGKCCCYLPLGNIAIGEMISVFETAQHPLFYTYYFRNMYRQFAKVVEGQNVKNLYYAELEPLKIHRPSILEQQKIADCLSSLDELIEAEDQKLEALQRHKKGLMQELFPSEGQTLPKRRFPEFHSAPEWEEKTLAELGRFIGGGTPSKSVPEYWQGEFPWISSSDLSENDIRNLSITKFITNEAMKESATKVVPKGSILFVSRVGVGKLAINNQDLCTSQDFTSFVPKETCNYYLAYYFLAKKELLIGLGQGTSIKGFSKNDIEDFKINIPSQKEQQKIADCLSLLDELNEAQTKKLKSLRLHKKGLMQQLFPNASEVQK